MHQAFTVSVKCTIRNLCDLIDCPLNYLTRSNVIFQGLGTKIHQTKSGIRGNFLPLFYIPAAQSTRQDTKSEIRNRVYVRWSMIVVWLHTWAVVSKSKVKFSHNPEGSRKLRLPDFMTTARYGDRLSALRTGRLYPQGIFLVLIFTTGWVDPRDMVWSEGNMSLKNRSRDRPTSSAAP